MALADSGAVNESRFQLFIDAVTDYAIFMLDPSGIVSSWNSGAKRIKGYTSDEVIGRHFSLFYIPEDLERDVPGQALKIAAEHGRFEAEGWRIRKDGSRFWANVVIDAVRDAGGALLGFAKITRDLTERVEALRQIEEARQQLAQSQKLEAIGHLTGGVAHDFNNLLQIITANLDLLIKRPDNRELVLKRAASALEGAHRAARLTRQLLAFARRQPLAPEVFNPARLVTDMTELLRRTLGEMVEVELVTAGGLWNTLLDRNQLESAIINLALNAKDAMPGGGKLTIEIGNAYLDDEYSARHAEVTPGQYVLLGVSDTGTGMLPETMERAFEPFFTTKAEGQGTGLGLSQVYGFIKQSGGHVKIYSEPRRGTTVKLYLPRVRQAAPEDVVTIPAATDGHGERVLVVEDEDAVRESVLQMLADLGYRAVSASDATEALAILRTGPVDLLFTDVVIPGPIGSRELAHKAQELHPGLAVLYTSGYTQNAIIHHGRLDEGVMLLSKPYQLDALARKIRLALGQKDK
jgi:PAS domain S-box-containing protein